MGGRSAKVDHRAAVIAAPPPTAAMKPAPGNASLADPALQGAPAPLSPVIAGIDPGVGGGLAVINDHGDCETLRMPVMRDGKQAFVDGAAVARFLSERDVSFAVIELVHSFSRQGVKGVFTFGCQYGGVVSVVRAACIPHKLVTPQRWKKDLGLSPDKDASRALAAARFPRAANDFARKCDDGRAEAALIAWWFLKSGYQAKRVA